ncbi:MAG: hypothetical protein ABFD96_24035, partial [Armatimonadia bacterium]
MTLHVARNRALVSAPTGFKAALRERLALLYRLWAILIGSIVLVSVAVAAPVTLYVAPAGSDGAAGTLAKPLGSVAGAQRAVRAARARGEVGPFKVVVRGGTYRLQEPIVFGPEDSGTKDAPVVYIAMKGE